jgi:hypothetical protein
MIDWTFALLFRPDVVKISLDSEAALLLREAMDGNVPLHEQTEGDHRSDNRASAAVSEGVHD